MNVESLKVDELKAELKKRGCTAAELRGVKKDLVARLIALLAKENSSIDHEDNENANKSTTKSTEAEANSVASATETEEKNENVILESDIINKKSEVSASIVNEEIKSVSDSSSTIIAAEDVIIEKEIVSTPSAEGINTSDMKSLDAIAQEPQQINLSVASESHDKIEPKIASTGPKAKSDKILELKLKAQKVAEEARKANSSANESSEGVLGGSGDSEVDPNSLSLALPTCNVRIDNFVRPLAQKILLQWLQEKLTKNQINVVLSPDDLWVNSIKTHCYLTLPTPEDALACIKVFTYILI